MKLITYLFILLLLSTLAQAQADEVLKSIPKKDVFFIGTITPHETFQKLDKETRESYEIAPILANTVVQMTQDSMDENLVESLKLRFANPEETGLQTTKDVFFWATRMSNPTLDRYAEDELFFQVVMPVADITKLEIMLADLFGEQATAPLVIGKANNIMHDGFLINWNKNRLILVRSSDEQSFFEEDEEFAARQQEGLQLRANALGNDYKLEETIFSDAQFQNHLQKKADIALWMDYDNLLSEIPVNQIPREGRETFKAVTNIFMGLKIAAYVQIQEKELVFEYTNYFGEEMGNIMRAATKEKANKNLLKYVEGENLMAFYSGVFSIEGYAETFFDELKKALNTTREGKILNNMIDIVDIFVDEDEMYTLWNGDVVLAMTDITTVEREFVSYEYNEESGNWDNEVVNKIQEPMPILMMGGSYSSKENVMKFIDLGINIGGLSKRADGVYVIAGSLEEMGMEAFVILNKGTLMITNNKKLAEKRKGFKCKERMNKTDWKNAIAHSQYGFVDIEKTIEVLEKIGEKRGEETPKDIVEAKETFDRIELKVTQETENSTTTRLRLILKDKEDSQNTLQTLVKYGTKGFMMMMMNNSFDDEEVEDMDDFDEDFKRL